MITTRTLRALFAARTRSETDTLPDRVPPRFGALSLAPARARAWYETAFASKSSRAENVTRIK